MQQSRSPDFRDLLYRDVLAYCKGDDVKAQALMKIADDAAKQFEQ